MGDSSRDGSDRFREVEEAVGFESLPFNPLGPTFIPSGFVQSGVRAVRTSPVRADLPYRHTVEIRASNPLNAQATSSMKSPSLKCCKAGAT